MGHRKQSSDVDIQEIVERIVDVAQPERIVLFGSVARHAEGPHSDVDLLVVKAGPYHHGQLLKSIYRRLHGVRRAVDVILATPEQVEQYKNTHCLVFAPALKEGREVYHADTLPAR